MNYHNQIGNIGSKLSGFPIVIDKILDITSKPDVCSRELNHIILLDPVLTAQILQAVNDSHSVRREIESLTQAIILLGPNTIRNITLNKYEALKREKESKDKDNHAEGIRWLWMHAVGSAVFTQLIASKRKALSSPCLERYFIMGLLHDIGRFVMMSLFADKYVVFLKEVDECLDLEQSLSMEKERFGLTHCVAGEILARQYGLPHLFVQASLYHHCPEKAESVEISECIYIVAIVSRYLNFRRCKRKHKEFIFPESWKRSSNLSQDLLEQMYPTVCKSMEVIAEFLCVSRASLRF